MNICSFEYPFDEVRFNRLIRANKELCGMYVSESGDYTKRV